MNANYKNWVPNGMITALTAGTALLGAGTAALMCTKIEPKLALGSIFYWYALLTFPTQERSESPALLCEVPRKIARVKL